jgi:nitroreductase
VPEAVSRVVAGGPSARALFRQRRSAVALDGRTSITLATFERMLARTLPQPGVPPFDLLPDAPAVHLLLFVHRVDGLEPGLYCLPRGPVEGALRAAMRRECLWQTPPGVAADLPLRLLVRADCREAAARLSCDQDIAGAGAFSLGMLAEVAPRLRAHGAWCYRRLYWEAGLVGQVLYLEAEAAGVRATGIGCYYDDPVHDVVGLEGREWQSLYHFTVGGAVDDERLTTLPAYPRG